MSEQLWNFAGIEGGSSEIQGSVQTTAGLLDEGKGSLAALAAVWGGSGSEAYQAVQMRWDSTSNELNAALQNLAHTISESGQTMAQTESGVTGMFA
jgi:early secretory antigenic target protein ESAT-6